MAEAKAKCISIVKWMNEFFYNNKKRMKQYDCEMVQLAYDLFGVWKCCVAKCCDGLFMALFRWTANALFLLYNFKAISALFERSKCNDWIGIHTRLHKWQQKMSSPQRHIERYAWAKKLIQAMCFFPSLFLIFLFLNAWFLVRVCFFHSVLTKNKTKCLEICMPKIKLLLQITMVPWNGHFQWMRTSLSAYSFSFFFIFVFTSNFHSKCLQNTFFRFVKSL